MSRERKGTCVLTLSVSGEICLCFNDTVGGFYVGWCQGVFVSGVTIRGSRRECERLLFLGGEGGGGGGEEWGLVPEFG